MPKILFLVLIFCSGFACGQQSAFSWKGKILAADTRKPIENAHVMIDDGSRKLYFISDKQGFVHIHYDFPTRTDTAVITHISYNTVCIKTMELSKSNRLFMNEQTKLLPETKITPSAVYKTGPSFPLITGGSSLLGVKLVLFFPPTTYSFGKIEKVEVAFSAPLFENKEVKRIENKLPVLLKIYAKDPVHNIPGEELLKDTIVIIRPPHKDRLIIDVSKYNITLPSNGIYCGFEGFTSAWYKEHGYLTEFAYKYKSETIPGRKVYYTPFMGSNPPSKKDKEKGYRIYQLGGFAGAEWKDITEMFDAILLIKLHIRK
jgi:hypothetical protein